MENTNINRGVAAGQNLVKRLGRKLRILGVFPNY